MEFSSIYCETLCLPQKPHTNIFLLDWTASDHLAGLTCSIWVVEACTMLLHNGIHNAAIPDTVSTVEQCMLSFLCVNTHSFLHLSFF